MKTPRRARKPFFQGIPPACPAVLLSWSSSTTSSASTSGGPLPCPLLGGPLPCSLLGGSTSMFTSRGSTSMFTSGGPLLCSLLGGPLSCSLLGGVPCDLSHNALIYCYRMPQCIMGKIHMGPPQLNRLTDKQTRLKTLPSRTLRMRAVTN